MRSHIFTTGSRARRLVAVTFTAALIAAVPFVGGSAGAQTQPGGPVLIMGIDAEDGGPGGHGPIGVYSDVIDGVLGNVTNGGSGLLVLGGNKSATDDVTTFWDAAAAGAGISVSYANGASGIGSQTFAGFAIVAVASSQPETPSGGLTDDENSALSGRATDIAAHVNGGGGLIALSQSGLSTPYAFLAGIGGIASEEVSYSDIDVTAEGAAAGLTDDLDVCCWHDIYTEWPDFLEILAFNAENDEEQVAALGGAQVVIGEPPPEDTEVGGEVEEQPTAAAPEPVPSAPRFTG